MRLGATPQPRHMTVSDLTERELVARIQERLPPAPDWLVVGIGDDAAVVEPEPNRLEVLSVDALIEGVHFDRRFTPPGAIGHRALAVNLSDLAAMGAAPRLALASFALPSDLTCADFDGIVSALANLAVSHRLHVVGGNLARSPGPLMIDVTVVGSVKRRQALTRHGAHPGDELFLTGSIGAAAAGLQMLTEGSAALSGPRAPTRPPSQLDNGMDACVRRYLYPEPRVKLGLLLGRSRAAAACVDASDGVADSLWCLAEASAVGAVVDGDALPIHPGARNWFETRGVDPVIESLSGGDDYELVFAVPPRLRRRLAAASCHGDAPITRIGVCTEDREVVVRRPSRGGAVVDTSLPRGYTHFK